MHCKLPKKLLEPMKASRGDTSKDGSSKMKPKKKAPQGDNPKAGASKMKTKDDYEGDNPVAGSSKMKAKEVPQGDTPIAGTSKMTTSGVPDSVPSTSQSTSESTGTATGSVRRSSRLQDKQKASKESSLKTNEGAIDASYEEILMKEEQHLLKIFPKEVWLLILGYFYDDICPIEAEPPGLGDLENIRNSSRFFHHLLLDKFVVYKFPMVWETFALWCHKNPEKLGFGPNKAAKKDKGSGFLTLMNADWYIQFLNLRLVCKKWQMTYDLLPWCVTLGQVIWK